MRWTARRGHRHDRPEDHVEELRAAAEALTHAEDDRHEQGLQAARDAQAEAERAVAKAVEIRLALHALVEGLRAGPQPEDRFAQGMEETFKNRRREDSP